MSAALDLGALVGRVALDSVAFDRTYVRVVRQMADLGAKAEASTAGTSALDRGLTSVAGASDAASAGLGGANAALTETGLAASRAAAATQAAAGASSELQAAQLRLVAAQERLATVQADTTATAGKLASAQASVLSATDRVVAVQTRMTAATDAAAAAQQRQAEIAVRAGAAEIDAANAASAAAAKHAEAIATVTRITAASSTSTTEAGVATSRLTQAQLRAIAAQERLTALEDSGVASTRALASAQASLIAANDRVALSQERVRTSSRFSSTTLHGLIGEATGLSSALEGIPTPVTVVAGALGKLGIAAGITGAAVAAFSIDLAQKFQAATTRIHTQADATVGQVARLSKGMLAMAGDVGTTPAILADAAYHIASVGQKSLTTAQQLRVLKIAAEGAKLGNADLVDVTNALDAALVANMKGVHNFSQVMGVMNSTVGAGDMTMQDFADAFGPLGSTFKGFGVTIQQAGAALAVFGDNNMRGALAGSQLRQSITALAAPLKAGRTELELWGIKGGDLSKQLAHGGLTEALDVLSRKMRENGVTAKTMGPLLAEMFGKRGPQQGLSTLINQLDRFHGKLDTVTQGGASFASSWAGYTKTFSYNLDAAKAAVEALAIQLGDKLLPYATKALHWIATNGVADLQQLGRWFEAHKQDFETWGHAIEAAVKPTFAAIKSAINLLTAVLDVFEGHWGAAWHHMEASFTDSEKSFKSSIQGILHIFEHFGSAIGSLASKAWHAFASATSHGISAAVGFVRSLPGHVASALAALPGVLGHAASSAWHAFLSASEHIVATEISFLRGLPHRIIAAIGDLSSLLIHVGESLIGGLVKGIEHAAGSVLKSALHHVTSLIPSWKGPPERDAMLLYANGQLIMGGLVAGIDSMLPSLAAALRHVTNVIAAAVAPAVTDPTALAGILSGDITGAVGRQQSAMAAKAGYQALNAAAHDATHALNDLKRADAQAENAAKKHALALSNEAHAAHQAAANMTSHSKATAAAKAAAERHARALDDEARAASQDAQKIANANAKKEKSAQHAADVATKAADKAKRAYDKEAQAAAAAAQVAEQAAQALVQSLSDAADQMLSKISDFESTISSGITGGFSLQSLWSSLMGTDANGNPINPTLDQMNAGAQAALDQATQFVNDMNAIVAEGGSQDLITQIAGMGPAAGDAFAQELLTAGPGMIQSWSTILDSMDALATGEAAKLGQAFFGAGVDILVALLKGLETAFPELKKALDPILNSLVSAFSDAGTAAGQAFGTAVDAGIVNVANLAQLIPTSGTLTPTPHSGPVADAPGGLINVAALIPSGTTAVGGDGATVGDLHAQLVQLNARVDTLAADTGTVVASVGAGLYQQAGQASARQATRDRRGR